MPRIRIGEYHGNYTPLEIESATLPSGRHELSELRSMPLSTSPGLYLLHLPIGPDRPLVSAQPAGLDEYFRYRISYEIRMYRKDNEVNHRNATPAPAITKAASKQTYYTIRLLADSERVDDAYRAYAYFRWVDDTLDAETATGLERSAFIQRQKSLLEQCFQGEFPQDVNIQERMLVKLLQNHSERTSGLQLYLCNMMQVMDFDVRRRGRLISQMELNEYTSWLAIAVMECIHHFVGHDDFSPRDETRYLAVAGAHIVHMLRDTFDDAQLGYYNIPREVLEENHIGPLDVHNNTYRDWVKSRVQLARQYFRAGKEYFARVENPRCRLACYAYIARFDWLLDTIEREGYLLRPQYDERKTIGTGLLMIWLTLSSQLHSRGEDALRQSVLPRSIGKL